MGSYYIKPIMAVTLIVEKMNSASPYPLIPNIFMPMIARRKMVTKMAGLRDVFQYWMVKAPEIISSGRTTSHCKR